MQRMDELMDDPLAGVFNLFREGNTRSQCVFFTQLADQARYELDIGALSPSPNGVNPVRD
jgi:hypothetical protein